MRTPVALDAAALLAEREAGTPIAQLARKHHVSRETVRRHLDKATTSAVDTSVDRALSLVPTPPEISGDTPDAVNASFKAAWLAAIPEGAKFPAGAEQRRLRDLHQRALVALKKVAPKAGPRARTPKATQTARLVEALNVKRAQGGKLSAEMKATRRTLSHADLVAWLKAVLVAHPETDLHTELEYAYWVSNLKTSTSGFTKAWDEACRS